MRKQTHFKKVVSFALAAAMAVSVCTAALAEDATNEATEETAVSEQVETESADETDNGIAVLTTEEGGQPVVFANEGEGEAATQATGVAYVDNDTSKSYTTLQEAIDAAQAEVVLTQDVKANVTVSNKTIALDLNGCSLSEVDDKTSTIIVNGGKLTVMDRKVTAAPAVSADYKTVIYDAGKITHSKRDVITVRNGGSLIVESGKIVSAGNGAASAIGNVNPSTSEDKAPVNSTITVNGGYLEGPEGAVGVYGRGATMNINGGVLVATDNAVLAGNGTVDAASFNGGTIINVTNGTLIGHIKTTGYIACGIYQPQAGELNISGGTIYADGGCGIMARAGNISVSDKANIIATGTATGYVGDRRYDLTSAAIVLDKKANYPGANSSKDGAGDEAVDIHAQITGGTFTADTESPIEVIVNADDTVQYLTVAGGTFNNKFDASYLASNYVFKTNDDGTYTVDVKTVDTKPAEPEKTEVAGKTEDIKSENVKKEDVANAAGSTTIADSKDSSVSDVSEAVKDAATVKIGEEEVKLNDDKVVSVAKDAIAEAVKKAAEKKPDAPEEVFDQDAENKDITIVAVPKLVVEPKAAANNDTDVSMTFDINMVYDVKATVADTVDKMNDQNTVTLEKNKEMPAEQVPTVAISLDVSALKIPEGQKVFVRHVKENGAVYYYETETKADNGIVKTVTFVNPDGFSEFTVMANKGVTVKIDGQDVTFTTEDIGKAFTAVPQAGYNWLGVSINGTVYTTFTKELYDAAYKGETLVGANAYEEIKKPEEPTPVPTATPAPVEEAAPAATAAPTATPDDSQYYTCVACGHHDWTATADGYKCNTCGHLETKQISGYKNVKGVYTPTTSSAKTAAAKASTIPQTSDEMPIVPIAIVAIAALLGLGVTAYMKKKQN